MKNQIRIQFSRDELIYIQSMAEEQRKMYEKWDKDYKTDLWERQSILWKGIEDKANQALIRNEENARKWLIKMGLCPQDEIKLEEQNGKNN